MCRSHVSSWFPLDVSKVTVRWSKRMPTFKEVVVDLLNWDVIPKGDMDPEECHLKVFVLSPTRIRECSYFTGHLVSCEVVQETTVTQTLLPGIHVRPAFNHIHACNPCHWHSHECHSYNTTAAVGSRLFWFPPCVLVVPSEDQRRRWAHWCLAPWLAPDQLS